MDTSPLSKLSNAELVEQVTTWAARVARGEAVLVELIGELDSREAWAEHGITSCANWLSWKTGWSGSTSRERVRVARALRGLPLIKKAFAEGRLSYCQVRGVTRIATPADEQSWLELARRCTGAQLAEISSGAARARAADTPEDERPPKPAARVEWDDDGDLLLTVHIPAHEAVAVLAVLEQHRALVQAERDESIGELVSDVLSSGASAGAPGVADLLAPELARGLDPLEDRKSVV